ncbi:rhamnose ABC transporter substrate-binding protein [Jannaschia sp. M317]|uniref:rhamnose ABC transporter substrate-binding protein n=1 Tax=Jannaschia sp. M317 TaxID=2867011 RepID=UPI0021A27377|nr:rhamnose ABC transporter substrate-binding protein [Jannaschia sp. M317]
MFTKMLRRTVLAGLCSGLAIMTLGTGAVSAQDQKRYAMVVRVLGNTAFELAGIGAQEAADELGVELIFTGPTENTAEGQVALINSLIAQRIDAIMITANDATALSPALRRASQRGIAVVTWDQDTETAARSLHIASATNELIALAPVKIALDLTDGGGDVGIVSGPANSTTQNEWVDEMVRLTTQDDAYKGLNVVETVYGDERSDKAYNEALGLVNKYENLEAIVAYTSVGIAAASQMVRDQGLVGKVKVTGLGFPTEMVDHVLSGATPAFAIWNMVDVGYTTVMATHALVEGDITGAPGETFEAARMGSIEIGENNVAVMGELFVYDASNVEDAAALVESAGK